MESINREKDKQRTERICRIVDGLELARADKETMKWFYKKLDHGNTVGKLEGFSKQCKYNRHIV